MGRLTTTTTTATTTRAVLLVLGWYLVLVESRRRLPNEVGLNTTDFGRHLLGQNVDVPKATSPDDHLVTALPLLDPSKFTTDHWAGLLPASDDGDKYLFYWLFAPSESDKPDEEIPLIIWLNGGPACSSMDGLWVENGPFRLVHSGNEWTIDIAPKSWHTTPAYVVYIDQPVGTGIAFTTSAKYPRNDEEVNTDFYYFLTEFFKLHADKFLDKTKTTLSRDFFFSGESHSGHYIPSMMNFIRKKNEASPEITMPLAGAAIGNGWIDPVVQYSAHEAAYGYSLIGRAQKRSLEKKEQDCQKALAKGQYSYGPCFRLLDDIVTYSHGAGAPTSASQYDYTFSEVKSQPREFPPGHKNVEAYLGGWGSISSDYRDVLEAIHSTPSLTAGQKYRECTDPPFNALKHQDGLGVTGDVVALLNNGVRLLFFNGVNDLICNHIGNEIAVENFKWTHQAEYQKATRYSWISPSKGELAGYMKEYENLMYLKILGSGHMVPMDAPDVSLDMMRNLVFGVSFDSYIQKLDAAEQSNGGDDCPVCPNTDCENCPVCPATQQPLEPASNGSQQSDTGKTAVIDTGGMTASTSGVLGLLFGMAIVVVLCGGYRLCGSRSKRNKVMPGSKYDMELPSSRYTDGSEEEYGEIS